MHNEPLFPGGVWPAHIVPTPGRLRLLDVRTSQALNGLGGGQWAPERPIAIGGAGVQLTLDSTLSGALRTGRMAAGIALGAPMERPHWTTPRTRSVAVPLEWTTQYAPYNDSGDAQPTLFSFVRQPLGLRIEHTSQYSFHFRVPALRLHNGATALSFRLQFRVGQRPASISQVTLPWFRIIRINHDASFTLSPNTLELFQLKPWQSLAQYELGDMIHSTNGGNWGGSNGFAYRCIQAGQTTLMEPTWPTTPGADYINNTVRWRVESGWSNPFFHFATPVYPFGMDPEEYFLEGSAQEIVLKVNLNEAIDTDNYEYVGEIIDPGGQQNIYHSLIVDLADITEYRKR